MIIPEHIGFILDGNRRWAKEQGLTKYEGHFAGYKALKEVLQEAYDRGIKYVSVYAFSSENWQRDSDEVSRLMRLALHAITSDLKGLIEQKVRVRMLGRTDGLSSKLLKAVEKAESATDHFTRGTLAICLNYGGQQEIVDAARRCLQDGLSAEEITEKTLSERLYAPEVPPVDMVIRTSGEHRLSNFMLWRVAYSELYFLDKFWPEMTKEDITDIIEEYNRRSRRFGA
ncbi:MAG TPA: polyprenyl diphosphate synthase [Patescibacteria group bacterium]|nr:polyprenyl diphosphate synthase [Patescibacteria group bacterium]